MSPLCYSPDMAYRSLADLFLSQADAQKDRPLYRFWRDGEWRDQTWAEAAAEVESIALGLLASGVSKGDRVALYAANRVEWCLLDWANICIGALTVPLYPSSTRAQIHHIVEHSGSVVLVVDSRAALDQLDASAPAMASVSTTVILDPPSATDAPASNAEPGLVSLDRLKEIGRAYGQEHPGRFREAAAALEPADDLTIIYTSGTTGEPKGVLTTHGHYLFTIASSLAAIAVREDDVALQFLPLAHSFGRLEHFVVVARGYLCAFARSIESLSADLQTIRPTMLFSVPRVYENAYRRIHNRVEGSSAVKQRLFRWAMGVGGRYNHAARRGERCGAWLRLRHRVADKLVLSKVRQGMGGRLRLAISGGAPLSEPIANFFQGLGVWIVEGYGLTETSTVTHVNRLDRYRVGTVGLPMDGVECRIAEDGEVLIRGANVMKGYFKDPAATREAIDDDGWFHTGDVGRIEDGGFLRITDRKKDLIVTSGGKNIAPQMIENHLREEPLISQAMVWGDKTSHLVALITLDPNEAQRWVEKEGFGWEGLEEAAADSRLVGHIRQRIRERNKELAPFEAVRDFRILPADFSIDTGELTPSMKLKRRIVMERYGGLLEEMLKQR